MQGFPDAARVVESGDWGAEETQDGAARLRVELAELPVHRFGKLNVVSYDV